MTPHPDSPGASPRSVTTRAEIGSAPSRRSDHPTAGTSVQHRDALVVGGGVAGLTAAWELTRAGLRPLVVEARGYTGGLVAAGVLAGVRVDLGAEGFAVRGDAVTSMVDALGLEIVGPAGGGAGLFLPPGPGEPVPDDDPARGWRLHRFVRDALLGIPARPLADDVVAIIGPAAAERAARDSRLGDAGTRPGDPTDLASFVRTRMGDGALDRLVSPIVSGIYSRDPAVLAADAVLPGLREATARLGSLQAAVGEALERRRARGRGRSTADATTAGGLTRLTDTLRSSVEAAGGDVLTRTGAQWLRPAVGEPATGLRADEPGGAPVGVEDGGVIPWDVAVAPTGRGATPSDEPVPIGPVRIVRAPRVVLACSAPAALRLLAGAGAVDGAEGGEGLRDGPGVLGGPGGSGEGRCRTDPTAPIGAPIARFMLAVRAPELAGAPMGSGLLVANAGGDRPVRAVAPECEMAVDRDGAGRPARPGRSCAAPLLRAPRRIAPRGGPGSRAGRRPGPDRRADRPVRRHRLGTGAVGRRTATGHLRAPRARPAPALPGPVAAGARAHGGVGGRHGGRRRRRGRPSPGRCRDRRRRG